MLKPVLVLVKAGTRCIEVAVEVDKPLVAIGFRIRILKVVLNLWVDRLVVILRVVVHAFLAG